MTQKLNIYQPSQPIKYTVAADLKKQAAELTLKKRSAEEKKQKLQEKRRKYKEQMMTKMMQSKLTPIPDAEEEIAKKVQELKERESFKKPQ